MKNFNDRERSCLELFSNLGNCWHLYTPENHPLVFTSDQEFKDGVSIFGLSISEYTDIQCLAFEEMNNHLHACLSGSQVRILEFFASYKHYLRNYLRSKGRYPDLNNLNCSLRKINSLEEMRNVIIYINRNGYVAFSTETPYTYPWGTNKYFFNPEARARYLEIGSRLTTREALAVIHSRFGQYKNALRKIDGYVSPLSFCNIDLAERLFRDAAHYFYFLTKKIELQKEIASQIGENIYYNDNDLYQITVAHCKNNYQKFPAQLNAEEKIEVAKMLRYEYNAGSKQLQRMLKIDVATLTSLGW